MPLHHKSRNIHHITSWAICIRRNANGATAKIIVQGQVQGEEQGQALRVRVRLFSPLRRLRCAICVAPNTESPHHVILYHSLCHLVDLKRQNRLKVVTDKPKLKVTMQLVSDNDVRKGFSKSHVLNERQLQGVPVERSDRLPGRLRTGTSGPRHGGALL